MHVNTLGTWLKKLAVGFGLRGKLVRRIGGTGLIIFIVIGVLAELGGFVGRTGDGEPGVLVLWRGLSRLVDMTYMFQVFSPALQERKSG